MANYLGSILNDNIDQRNSSSDDVLDGLLGADTMRGGDGSDQYFVDNAGDVVEEFFDDAFGGNDTVFASVSFSLDVVLTSPVRGVENLVLTGSAGLIGIGNALGNTITGNTGSNLLSGLNGNDTLNGGVGNDTLLGGDGNDVLNGGGGGNDSADGGNGDDYIYAVLGGDTIIGGAGTDTLDTTSFAGDYLVNLQTGVSNFGGESFTQMESVISGVGNDTLIGTTGNNILNGGGGNDSLVGGDGNDTSIGGLGNDSFTGGLGIDSMQGDAGDDSFDLNAVLNLTGWVIDGGNDTDTIDLASGTLQLGTTLPFISIEQIDVLGTEMQGTAGNDSYDFQSITTIAFGSGYEMLLRAGSGNDTVVGTNTVASGAHQIYGDGGDDSLVGGASRDFLSGGSDFDTLIGGDGADTLQGGFATDSVNGGGGDDVLRVLVGEFYDAVDGGTGFDTLDHSGSTYDGTTFDFLGSQITGVGVNFGVSATLAGIEVYQDGSGSNTIVGDGGGHAYFGNAGNDTLRAEAGATAADTLDGGVGADTYVVGNALAVIVESGFDGGTIDTVEASVTRTLGDNVERLTLTGTDAIDGYGNALDNLITGNAAANQLFGNGGTDTLNGGAGNDTLTGTGTLRGEGDNDRFFAAGAALVEGGDGDDLVFGAATVGGSFDGGAGIDVIDLSGNGNSFTETTINLDQASFSLGGATYANFEGVVATDASETLVGNSATNVLSGQGGDDTLTSGAGSDTLFGGNGADLLAGGSGVDQLDGGAGADLMIGGEDGDLYVVDNAGDAVVETGSTGRDRVISGLASYTLGDTVEDLSLLFGTSSLEGTGNGGDNNLFGNDGANRLDGGAGADTMLGGGGADVYVVDSGGDFVVEDATAPADTDQVLASVSYTLGDNVEQLTLTGNSAIDGTGNALNNRIEGNAAANLLDGGAGLDTLVGGAGNDTYLVDGADAINELGAAASEIDVVRSTASFTLGANLENLTLLGTALNGTGNTLNNVINGNDLANTLDGSLGNDTLVGGLGNDTYAVNATLDVVVESNTAASEIDTVRSTASYTLSSNLENLTLLTGAASGTGNALKNVITGNAAANTLDGKAGFDTLIGGAGNDTYLVDSLSDVISETSTVATEIDTVITTANNRTLGTNLEKLTLSGSALIGSGNTLANTLTGNALANTLNGLGGNDVLNGGTGNDTLAGGTGNDTYIVDSALDVITETSTSALEIDTVQSSVSRTLGSNLEKLTLTGTATTGTGNTLANTLTGNAAANLLSGLGGNDILNGGTGNDTLVGGAGKDTLDGGAGLDVFRFESVLSATTNLDRINNFVAADDVIQLENAVFTGLAAGALAAAAFRIGAAAGDASDRIVYNNATGQLFFDADGTGASAAILFATVVAGTTITAADFSII